MKVLQLYQNDDVILVDDDLTVDNIKLAIMYKLSLDKKWFDKIEITYNGNGTKLWKITSHPLHDGFKTLNTCQVIISPHLMKNLKVQPALNDFTDYSYSNIAINEIEPRKVEVIESVKEVEIIRENEDKEDYH